MKTLANSVDVDALRARIASLTPGDARRWGSMAAAQMVCHLADAFAGPLSQHPMPPSTARRPPIPLGLYKWLAFNFPAPWPKNVPTIPEMDQQIGGTPPTASDADRALLLTRLDAFVSFAGPWPAHPIFGAMNAREWMRWGWLHTDHHLRQFGR
jgi:hypothetical protein